MQYVRISETPTENATDVMTVCYTYFNISFIMFLLEYGSTNKCRIALNIYHARVKKLILHFLTA